MTYSEPSAGGLPAFERFFLNAALKSGSAVVSDRRALGLFLSEAETILTLVDETDVDFASQQVLVPRFQGMEDSSRNWSLFMVLEHLSLIDRVILQIVDALRDGMNPRGEIELADFKPSPDAGYETVDQFRRTVREYRELIEQKMPLRNRHRFAHPWFGPLNAHQWHCLAAVHHRLHRKQVRKIMALLGQV